MHSPKLKKFKTLELPLKLPLALNLEPMKWVVGQSYLPLEQKEEKKHQANVQTYVEMKQDQQVDTTFSLLMTYGKDQKFS